ncbi:VOC family protein, partial [Burkholderia multivorans]
MPAIGRFTQLVFECKDPTAEALFWQ